MATTTVSKEMIQEAIQLGFEKCFYMHTKETFYRKHLDFFNQKLLVEFNPENGYGQVVKGDYDFKVLSVRDAIDFVRMFTTGK